MILVARPLSVFICLLPYKSMPVRAKVFMSWVGLRGAVPIIFATYPLIHNVEGSSIIFNIVFFITLVSLTVQGTTISLFARKLNLDMPEEKTGNEFGVEIPEELDSQLNEVVLTEEMLAVGNKLSEMNTPMASDTMQTPIISEGFTSRPSVMKSTICNSQVRPLRKVDISLRYDKRQFPTTSPAM